MTNVDEIPKRIALWHQKSLIVMRPVWRTSVRQFWVFYDRSIVEETWKIDVLLSCHVMLRHCHASRKYWSLFVFAQYFFNLKINGIRIFEQKNLYFLRTRRYWRHSDVTCELEKLKTTLRIAINQIVNVKHSKKSMKFYKVVWS